MQKVGFIGLGDMGMGMAKNLLKTGFELSAYDIRPEALDEIAGAGARVANSAAEIGARSDKVFIMVLDGTQVKQAVLGKQGLLEGLKPDSTIICTATILRSEILEVESAIKKKGIHLVDCPVSGGQPGAQAGTLTIMAAAKTEVFESCKQVLQAVGKHIYHIGDEIGMGQSMKAALSALVGSTYPAIFEALVLGVKAGIKPEVLYQVIRTSVVGSFLFENTARLIMERKFKGSGSQIKVMHKDLGISMSMAKELGVPMFATSTAYEVFEAGKSLYSGEDNWAVVKLLENIAGVKVEK